jgi:plasmid maintenance system antidote protein VapI
LTYNQRHMSGGALQGWLIDVVIDGLARIGMTQTQLAARLGVTQKHLSTVFNGHAMGTLAFWDHALTVLGIDIDSLS